MTLANKRASVARAPMRQRSTTVATTIAAVSLALWLASGCAKPPASVPVTALGHPTARPIAVGSGLPDALVVAGTVLAVTRGFLRIEVCAENIIRVAFAPERGFFARATLATSAKRCAVTPFTVRDEPRAKLITTAALAVRVDLPDGRVSFSDARTGTPILVERAAGRTLTPAAIPGEAATFHVRQQWERADDESFYGLGQHQQDLLDLRDVDLDLRQYNTEITVPFLVSSAGYGILWDNTSFTRFGDLADAVPLPGATGLYAPAAAPGALPGDVAVSGPTVDWQGTLIPPATGDYLFRTYSAGGVSLTVGGATLIDHWRQHWLPGEDLARLHLAAGTPVAVRLRWTMDGTNRTLRLRWKTPVPDRSTSFWSKVGDGVDYTLVYGGSRPDLDRVIAGYRQITGEAPMMPRWAFGLWQSRERYRTQQESLDVVHQFRARRIPFDNIVQDWQYWNPRRWGSHAFDPERFPDPDGWIRALHGAHAHLMVSVWPKFYPGTPTFDALAAGGFLFTRNLAEKQRDFLGNVYTVYDAFDPDARRLYWSQIDAALRVRGVDAWWMDSTEPEMVDGPFASAEAQIAAQESHMTPTRLGSGARVLNAFSLVNSQAIYEGARAAAPDHRVFILTRNGFAGQQRYAAASWSGDVSATWTALRKQIPAGLGFSISGIPYWSVDSGGFAVPYRFAKDRPDPADREEWRELGTRWFQYATFLPILRSHGQWPHREMWQYGDGASGSVESSPAFRTQLAFDRLRYRLLPYIYALAAQVTHQAGTILRPLVMDFPGDRAARAITDEYLFGPALLVAPVTSYGARTRPVYLPADGGAPWYDFWTGAAVASGPIAQAAAPYDTIPVYARAGTILPLGPDLQFVGEKPADPITLLIYEGADGEFTLYEDDGESYRYEQGQMARIPLSWNQATRTFTIGARQGSFPGMLARRQFQIVTIGPGRAVPYALEPKPALIRDYDGAGQTIAVPVVPPGALPPRHPISPSPGESHAP
jgi:alpha-D-xyloside xylohydrolase